MVRSATRSKYEWNLNAPFQPHSKRARYITGNADTWTCRKMPPMLFTALVGLIFNLLMPGLLPERLQFAATAESAIVVTKDKSASH